MKYVLITGVAGLIGSNFAEYVLDKTDYSVVGIDDMFGGYPENMPVESDRFVFHKFTLGDNQKNLEYVFQKYSPEYVFHFAAYAAEGLSPFIRYYNYKNNVLSTVSIVNSCINFGVRRLVYTSSMSVYGRGMNPNERFDETLTPAPEDPYAISKYACEMDIMSAGMTHGLDWCILRPHNVYGKKQNIWDRYRNVLGIWMYQKLNGEPLTIYGDGTQSRAFSYIEDSLPCIWKAAILPDASKQIINIGGRKRTTINEACDVLLKVFGSDTEVTHLEPRYEVKHAVPSFSKSVQLLDYEENNDLYTGLTKMWEWAQQQPKRERFKWPFYEVEKGIYSYWK